MTALLDDLKRLVERMIDRALARRAPGVAIAEVTELTTTGCRLNYLTINLEGASAHARITAAFAGDGYGAFLRPSVGENVVVSFEGGDLSRPIVIGSVWRPEDDLPDDAVPDDTNPTRLWRTPAGHQIAMMDASGVDGVTITTAGGLSLTLDDQEDEVRISTPAGLQWKMSNRSREVTVDALSRFQVNAQTIDLSASSEITASAPTIDLEASLRAALGVSAGAALTINPGRATLESGIAASVELNGPITRVDGVTVLTHIHPATSPVGPVAVLPPIVM